MFLWPSCDAISSRLPPRFRQFSDYRDREPEKCLAARKQLFDLYNAGRLKPHVMATYPLERYSEALALVRDRKVIGKVVLTTA